MTRRYNDEELRRILRLASEADPGARTSSDDARGHTLEDIAAIGREAGLDPSAVHLAARIAGSVPVASGSGSTGAVVFGAPAQLRLRLDLPGRLDASAAARVEDVLEHALGRAGELRADKGRLVWREEHGIGSSEVTLAPVEAGTEVRIEIRREGHLLMLVLALVTVMTVALALGGGSLLLATVGPVVTGLAWLGLPLLGARVLWKRQGAELTRRLEEAAMGLAALPVVPRLPPGDEPTLPP